MTAECGRRAHVVLPSRCVCASCVWVSAGADSFRGSDVLKAFRPPPDACCNLGDDVPHADFSVRDSSELKLDVT